MAMPLACFPSQQSKIFSNSCIFFEILAKSYICTRKWLVLHPMGNPESVPDYPKYLDTFLMVLLETFTTGLIFVRQSKQGATTVCFNQN